MPIGLSIHVFSSIKPGRDEIKFYEADEWSSNTEKEFLARIQDIVSIARKISNSFEVSITIETNEAKELSFLLHKKLATGIKINNQKLSIREIEILGLIMQGLTNNEIAEKLFISYETVKSHRKNILEKTGAKNTASLINHYHQTFFEK